MADARKEQLAEMVFQALTAHLSKIGIRKFDTKRDGDDYVIDFIVNGDDLPMHFYLIVDTGRQILRMISPLPVQFGEDQIRDGAVALCAVNRRIVNGRFDMNVRNGKVAFSVCTSFAESLIADRVYEYLVSISVNTVDDYNDKLEMLAKNMCSLEDLLEQLEV